MATADVRVSDEVGELVRQVFTEFLETFVEPTTWLDSDAHGMTSEMDMGAEDLIGKRYYLRSVVDMKTNELSTLLVDFKHLLQANNKIALTIQEHYVRLEPFLRQSIQAIVRKYIPDYLYKNRSGGNSFDSATEPSDRSGGMRDFWVSFYNLPKVSRLRELRGEDIGKLDALCGTVTRASQVRPELLFGTFECDECGAVISNVEQQFMYTEPIMCQNSTCQNRVNWTPLLTQSVFCDWQKVRVQENPSEIPSGAMPRSIDIVLRHEMVERAKAGDKVKFTGTVIVIPDISQLSMPGHRVESSRVQGRRGQQEFSEGITGLKALGVRDLGYKLAFLACHCISESQKNPLESIDESNAAQVVDTFQPEEVQQLTQMVANPNIYNALVRSIAPQIYGHEEIKRGILLQLLGGVHKSTAEGINLRGDINICIVGDPSTAKSQFLKYIAALSPRSVFTSGKASSAAGLTAAVTKDEETGEFTIEAGALMLADNGICCIDEFDKMDLRDQVAIHEAMEQQTISIAKAGVHASLNARTSILAAANPVHGRYDKRLTLRQNIAMSAPIMSRFDLFFVVQDECDSATDSHVAQHIINVHRYRDASLNPEYSIELIQKYLRFARAFHPKLQLDAAQLLKECYKKLRSENDLKAHRVTVRQLESMIRLSEALARVHCSEEITAVYVREAYRLLKKSILHIESTEAEIDLEADGTQMERDLNAQQADTASSQIPEASQMTDPGTVAQPHMQITHEELHNMTNMFVTRLTDTHEQEGEDESEGVRRSELIQWYLEKVEDMIQSEEDLNRVQRKAELVIRHLTKRTGVLLQLRADNSFGTSSTAATASLEDDDPIIVLNPSISFDPHITKKSTRF